MFRSVFSYVGFLRWTKTVRSERWLILLRRWLWCEFWSNRVEWRAVSWSISTITPENRQDFRCMRRVCLWVVWEVYQGMRLMLEFRCKTRVAHHETWYDWSSVPYRCSYAVPRRQVVHTHWRLKQSMLDKCLYVGFLLGQVFICWFYVGTHVCMLVSRKDRRLYAGCLWGQTFQCWFHFGTNVCMLVLCGDKKNSIQTFVPT